MGSDDDTHVPNPVPAVQEPKNPSIAKTRPSKGGGEADGSEPSSPSSRRHQKQVHNLKDKCEIMDVPMGPEDNLINEAKALVKEPNITLVASTRSDRVDLTPSDKSGKGHGSGAPCPRSLTQEVQTKNWKENWKRITSHFYSRPDLIPNVDHLWFAEFVAKLRNDPCLENSKVDRQGAPIDFWNVRLLHMAVLMEDLEMVQKILESPLEPNMDLHIDSCAYFPFRYSALDLAIICGDSEIVDALLKKNAEVNTSIEGSLQLAVLYAHAGQIKNTSKIIQLLVDKGIDVNVKDSWGYSAFYLAVVKGKTNIVKELLKWKDKIKLNEACEGGRPPIQIAKDEGFKDIESALMQCEDVRRYIEEAFRDRQAYVDAANAILVGAALIASVTFASWLQPPLSYTTSYDGSSVAYVDVEHNSVLGCFWVFNTLSFYFAIGAVVFGAHSVLPRRQLFITEIVKKLSLNLFLTSILLAFSVLFVIVAFGIAGFIVLIPILRYRWYMIAPTILGGLVCVVSIGYLFISLWMNRPWNIRNRKRNASESDDIDWRRRMMVLI